MAATIAISMGDPRGIGPEVILKALCAIDRPDLSFIVFGDRSLFLQLSERLGCSLPQELVEWVEVGRGGTTDLSDMSQVLAGQLQVRALELAADAVASGRANALCTAPITKAAARSAGFPFPGHTEFLAERFQTDRYASLSLSTSPPAVAMMLAGPALRVVPITGHLPLREVAGGITVDSVSRTIQATARGLVDLFRIQRPCIALAALNPHAGEAGMLGSEEQELLVPGLEHAARELSGSDLHVRLQGPIPADSLFVDPTGFDAVVCCYHDQALIPLKMLNRDESVNITLGLPIVRTSPAHGSALDIAGQGTARPQSMIAALRLAGDLAGSSPCSAG